MQSESFEQSEIETTANADASAVQDRLVQRTLNKNLGVSANLTQPTDPYTGKPMLLVEWPEGDFALIAAGLNGEVHRLYQGDTRPKNSKIAMYPDDVIRYFGPSER